MTYHYCISDRTSEWREAISKKGDDEILYEFNRLEFRNVSTYNDIQWRIWRRLVRQEAHKRGISV